LVEKRIDDGGDGGELEREAAVALLETLEGDRSGSVSDQRSVEVTEEPKLERLDSSKERELVKVLEELLEA
jgi:hypothetical protein